jgi:Mrp family chromosome partitioning ATPase
VRHALAGRPTTLADYLAIIRRRIWIIAIPLIVAPAMAVLLSSRQQPLYRASAEIYVKRSDVAAASVGVTNPTLQQDPVRFLKTQAGVARDPKLARRVVDHAGVPGVSAGGLLASSSVEPQPDADILEIAVNRVSSGDAVRLTNAYADEFAKYRTELDTARINDAIESVKKRMQTLRANGVSISSAAYGALLQNQTQLETVGKLLADNTQVLRPAEGAAKIRPRTRRNGILGLLLGGMLGIAMAFVAEALDKRVRSEGEIAETLGMPLLGRLPRPSRKLRKANELVMLAEPRSIAAEPIRTLRTNIEFANLERNARAIMITSSVQREGKSTTVANLAVALTRAGRRVALVDLDLRRPFLHRFFRIKGMPGVADVVLGRFELSDALRSVPVASPTRRAKASAANRLPAGANSSNGHGNVDGILQVLPAGTIPLDAGELVGSEALGKILEKLRKQFDFVLIDAPPLLVVGDAMTLSAKVDAIFVVTRLKVAHRGMLHEIARLLETCPAEKLGYVVASAELGEGYGYAYASWAWSLSPPSARRKEGISRQRGDGPRSAFSGRPDWRSC